MLTRKKIIVFYGIIALAAAPSALPAQESRRCSFLVQGLHADAGDCLYREADGYYEVAFRSKTYTLLTNTSSGQPKLFIDGSFTPVGEGNYGSSITGACGLFIALSRPKEEFSRSLDNYDRGLCVSQ